VVHDDIKYASEYFNLSPGIRLALEHLQRTDFAALDPGRYDVDGERVFALLSDYTTRAPEESFWEAHRRHVDVQYVHSGCERIGYGDLAAFVTDPYDDDRDLTVARGGSSRFVELAAGRFAILFPHEAHMPGLIAHAPETVRKIVMKVRLLPPDMPSGK
jgi:biofilm protein TabA